MQPKERNKEQAGVTHTLEETGPCANILQLYVIKEEKRSHTFHISRRAVLFIKSRKSSTCLHPDFVHGLTEPRI